jgi:hypothetical protein
MIRAVYGLMGLGMCLLSAPALANLSLVNYNGFEVRQSGNTWTFSHEPPSSTALRGGTVLPNAAVSSSQRALVASKTLPYGKGLPVDVVAKIPAGNLARALVGAGRVLTPVGAAVTAVELLNYFRDAGIFNVKHTPNGLEAERIDPGSIPSTGFEYRTSTAHPWSPTKAIACSVDIASATAYADENRRGYTILSTEPSCKCSYEQKSGGEWNKRTVEGGYDSRVSPCRVGSYVSPNGCTDQPSTTKMSEQEIIDKIALDSGWPTSAAIAAQKAINSGVPIQTDTPSASGPGNILGEKTTTTESVKLNPGTNTPSAPGATNTDPGTKTTTKTSTTNASYAGPNVTTTTTTTTVTNITNNITNITTTEKETENKEDDEEQEDPPTDTPFKDIPDLYKQKYPDGIGGVVNKKMDELKATPLFGLPALLTPSLPSTGSCPSWQLDLSLASWAGYGTHAIQAPCWVWDFGKVVIIISALLLARRLIFGG